MTVSVGLSPGVDICPVMKNSTNRDKSQWVKYLATGIEDLESGIPSPGNFQSYTFFLFLLILLILTPISYGEVNNRPSVLIEQDGITLSIRADKIEGTTEEVLTATGNVIAEYGDTRLSAEKITYNKRDEILVGEGDLLLAKGVTWLKGSRAEFNVKNNTGVIFEAAGFTDEELYINADKVFKTGDKTYTAEDGFLTSCTGDVPKWQIRIRKADITVDESYKLRGTVFKIKKSRSCICLTCIFRQAKKSGQAEYSFLRWAVQTPRE